MSGSSFPRMRVPSAAGVVAASAIAGIVVLLVAVRDTLPVFVVALILAYVMDPAVTWLAARRVPRGIAALLVMTLTVLLCGLLTTIFLETVISQAAAFVAILPAAFKELEAWLTSAAMPDAVRIDLLAALESIKATVLAFDFSVLLEPIVNGLIGILGAFFTLLVLPFFLFYVLSGRPGLAAAMRRTVPAQWSDDTETVLRLLTDGFGTYVRAEAVVAGILGVLTFCGLMLLSVLVDPRFADFALLLAIIAAFSELIPNFGPWIAAIPAVLFTLTISAPAIVAVIVLYVIFLEGQVLVPKIEGGAFSFHPALVLFIVVAGVALMGILGAIVALPVTASAWRTLRYAFRRAGGEPAGWATATRGDEGEAEREADDAAGAEAAPTSDAETRAVAPGTPGA